MDSKKVISYYKGCLLNSSKSKIDSDELGGVWKYIHNKNLNGAHDSKIDVQAQCPKQYTFDRPTSIFTDKQIGEQERSRSEAEDETERR